MFCDYVQVVRKIKESIELLGELLLSSSTELHA
jgi:hypothetical protein